MVLAVAKLTDSTNSLLAVLVPVAVSGVIALGAGYTIGWSRGYDSGLHYSEEQRAASIADQFRYLSQPTTLPTSRELDRD